MRRLMFSFLLISGILFSVSCDRSSLVGSGLFTPDSIDLFYEDDFDIRAKTVRVDSAITFDLFTSISASLVGVLEDPIFGKTVAESYIDLHLSSIAPQFQYGEDGIEKQVDLDSAVLILAFEPEAFYGDTVASHEISVEILDLKLTFKDTVYSTFRPNASEVVARNTLIPNYQDSVFIVEPGDSTETAYDQQLRLRFDYNFIQETIEDTSLVSTDSKFTSYAPGIRISSIPVSGSSLWGIDHSRVTEYPYNSIIVYYKKGDDPQTYRIFVDGERHTYIKHDYTGSVVEEFLDDYEKGDSLLFLQGLAGTEVEMEIPVLADETLKDFLINKAELEFFVVSDTEDEQFSPIDRIILERYRDDGQLDIIEDVFLAFEVLTTDAFDGNISEVQIDGKTIKKYSAKLSIHAMRVLNSDDPDIRLRIKANNKVQRPNRSVIFGPGHSEYPMKFKLTYSK